MDVQKNEDGFTVKLNDEELEILKWIEARYGPNEFRMVAENWMNQRKADQLGLDQKNLKTALEQLPEDLRKLLKEKLNELRFEN